MRVALCYLLACASFSSALLPAAAEEASTPRELTESFPHSEIGTIGDLQRLLETHSAENEAVQETKWYYRKERLHDDDDLKSSQTHPRRKRSIEEAVPAVCKTRSVVYEIPRSQVDSMAVNFLIWPPCVEVSRCSGCCNTSTMRCHASKTYHRTVKVAKVEYVRRRPKLREVLVQLEDHLECVCVPKHHLDSRLHTADIR
ncbi:platelet-derived growth factor alpha polypeptide a isoform X1 [Electrophorus electricus]|uniref:platelet-derived growth factor alpha polypeptide a isoform X1 n=1 Tax=Electrophorus electricus TaxID=8005 RepID=UPI0015D09642|nr:platelet-derived growth factor alpha polypeptide a isoform X1 [Electrophorus electricus]